jgi:hypothetical protein
VARAAKAVEADAIVDLGMTADRATTADPAVIAAIADPGAKAAKAAVTKVRRRNSLRRS